MPVSICIPTYNRTNLLLEALESCLEQSLKPFEIIIGDDSTNNETEKVINEIKSRSYGISIRYCHNTPSLGQAKNIRSLFKQVSGDKVVLLHDDDLLLPQALEEMYCVFQKEPQVKVVFGKQYVIDENGETDYSASELLNNDYYRTSKYEGSVLKPIEAGFVQQFPNDGYMLDTSILKYVNYSNSSPYIGSIGNGCEYDFGLQLGIHGFVMFYLDKYTAKYRLSSSNSISSSTTDDAAFKSFMILLKTDVPVSSRSLKSKILKRKAPTAIIEAVNNGNRTAAVQMYFSKWHRKKIFTLGGMRRLFCLLFKV